MKSDKSHLAFPALGDPKNLKVIAYSDATHASLPSGASQGALIVFLNGNGRVAPIMWQSKKLERVTKSPLASETMALAEGADAGCLIAAIVKEVFGIPAPKVMCITDNKSITSHLQTSHVIRDTRLRVDVARIKEMIKLNEMDVKWVEKSVQLADPMTKAGASAMKLLEVLREAKL